MKDESARTARPSIELLRNTLDQWADLHGKKLSSEAIGAWLGIFGKTPPAVLALALTKLTETTDRMPVPGHLTRAIALIYESRSDLMPRKGLTYREGRDAKGVACLFWSDGPNTPAYRAVDCPEGRAFLAELAKVSGKSRDESAKLMQKWSSQPEHV